MKFPAQDRHILYMEVGVTLFPNATVSEFRVTFLALSRPIVFRY